MNPRVVTPERAPWHAVPAGDVEGRLGTGPGGLTAAEVEERLARCGPNQLEEQPPTPAVVVFLRQFRSPLIYILVAAAVVTIAFAEYIDASVIGAVLLLNAIIGFTQERKAEGAVRALMQLVVPQARVVRDGEEQDIDSRRLVPGAVVLLEPGSRVPADVRLVDVNGLQVDESLLTGESLPVTKRAEPVGESAPLADRTSMGRSVVTARSSGSSWRRRALTVGFVACLTGRTASREWPGWPPATPELVGDVGGEAGLLFDAMPQVVEHLVERGDQARQVGISPVVEPGVEVPVDDASGDRSHPAQRSEKRSAGRDAHGHRGEGGCAAGQGQGRSQQVEGALHVGQVMKFEVQRAGLGDRHADNQQRRALDPHLLAGGTAVVDDRSQPPGHRLPARLQGAAEPALPIAEQGRLTLADLQAGQQAGDVGVGAAQCGPG